MLVRVFRAGIVIASAVIVALYVWAAIAAWLPRPTFGVSWSPATGRVENVTPGGPAARAGVAVGDRALDPQPGDTLGYVRATLPRPSDTVRFAGSRGAHTIVASAEPADVATALRSTASIVSDIILIAFAVLLCVRRPGVMAFAFWLYAATEIDSNVLFPLFAFAPAAVALILHAIVFAFVAIAYGIPLVAFALRFPTGRLSRVERPAEVFTWFCYVALLAISAYGSFQLAAGSVDFRSLGFAQSIITGAPLFVASAILIARFLRMKGTARAQTAWAIVGFVGSALFGLLFVLVNYAVERADWVDWFTVPENLFPLLAVYPILRYRLFDIGFVINRATLYSVLTLAAVASLAGVNWLAQRFVTDRLALILQPVAAILIGLGYFRVRAWAQTTIERVLFRDRYAAERHLERTMRGLALAERPETVDDAVVNDAAATLSLTSAAVFRRVDDAFVRVMAIGWNDADVRSFAGDDRLARDLQTDEPTIRLTRTASHAANVPPVPADATYALGFFRRGLLAGFAFYGRHRNGTELDSEEVQLLRSLLDAAALAYDAADATAARAELRAMRHELVELRAYRLAAERRTI
jgi:lipid-A-disaccharide synthase-like uncharacterized protein